MLSKTLISENWSSSTIIHIGLEGLGDWRIGRLEDWRIGGLGGLEDWGIGGLGDWGIGGLNEWLYPTLCKNFFEQEWKMSLFLPWPRSVRRALALRHPFGLFLPWLGSIGSAMTIRQPSGLLLLSCLGISSSDTRQKQATTWPIYLGPPIFLQILNLLMSGYRDAD